MKAPDHAVAIIGGGQAGLAVAYYLRRAGLDVHIFDAGDGPGGAWVHGWDSLRLFSPAAYSSLPGWPMPPAARDGFPTRDEVIDYLTRYEARYGFPVERPKAVDAVEPAGAHLRLRFADGLGRAGLAVGEAKAQVGAGGLDGVDRLWALDRKAVAGLVAGQIVDHLVAGRIAVARRGGHRPAG